MTAHVADGITLSFLNTSTSVHMSQKNSRKHKLTALAVSMRKRERELTWPQDLLAHKGERQWLFMISYLMLNKTSIFELHQISLRGGSWSEVAKLHTNSLTAGFKRTFLFFHLKARTTSLR